jgi:hypothetical protein
LHRQRQNDEDGSRFRIRCCFPIVAVRGPLFFLDAQDPDSGPVESPHCILVREVSTRNTKGYFLIDFVQADFFNTFIDERLGPVLDRIKQYEIELS